MGKLVAIRTDPDEFRVYHDGTYLDDVVEECDGFTVPDATELFDDVESAARHIASRDKVPVTRFEIVE